MKIKIICVGNLKEDYLVGAIKEYDKRLSVYANINMIEVKEVNTTDSNKNKIEEGKLILKNVKDNDFLITLEIKGRELDSLEFANYIKNHYTYSNKDLCFVIGGSEGLSDEVSLRSDFKLSFGKMTYPHQLMRVVLYEQIYRAFTIINNKTYHK